MSEVTNDKIIKERNMESHPCQYCETPCFGLQCKNCHLKMVAEREGDCVDCKNNSFIQSKCLDNLSDIISSLLGHKDNTYSGVYLINFAILT